MSAGAESPLPLHCPRCGTRLIAAAAAGAYRCPTCRQRYALVDGRLELVTRAAATTGG